MPLLYYFFQNTTAKTATTLVYWHLITSGRFQKPYGPEYQKFYFFETWHFNTRFCCTPQDVLDINFTYRQYKAKARISKRLFQENKAHQIFRKTKISYPLHTHVRDCVSRKQSTPKTNISYSLIRTRTCAYHGVRNVPFQKIWRALFSWNTHFEIRPFALLPTIWYLTVFTFCDSNS